MRDWRDAYLKEVLKLQKSAKPGEEIDVAKLPINKRRGPVLIGDKFDKYLQEKLIAMRPRGTPIGTSVVIGVGLGSIRWRLKHQAKQKVGEENPTMYGWVHYVRKILANATDL